MNPNLDQILLQNQITRDEDDRQFRCRMDELKDKEQRNMWSFIYKSISRRNRKAKDKFEKEIDLLQ